MEWKGLSLPTMRLAAIGDVAPAARSCQWLLAARRLAEWTGERRLTKSHSLRGNDARAAVRDLGLSGDPGAAGSTDLQRLWRVAIDMDFLEIWDGCSDLGPGMEWDLDDDEDVVELWIHLLLVTVDRLPMSRPAQAEQLPFMLSLYRAVEGLSVEDLVQRLIVNAEQKSERIAAADPGKVRPLYEVVAQLQLDALAEIDAVVLKDGSVRLTDLGRHGVRHWFEHVEHLTGWLQDIGIALTTKRLDSSKFTEETGTTGGVAGRDRAGG
jgi:hypothetical protein